MEAIKGKFISRLAPFSMFSFGHVQDKEGYKTFLSLLSFTSSPLPFHCILLFDFVSRRNRTKMPSTLILLPLILSFLFYSLLGITASPIKSTKNEHDDSKNVGSHYAEAYVQPPVSIDKSSDFLKRTVHVDDSFQLRDSNGDNNGEVEVIRGNKHRINKDVIMDSWNDFLVAKSIRQPHKNRQSGPVIAHWVSTMDKTVKNLLKDWQPPPDSDHGVTALGEKRGSDQKIGKSGVK